MSYNRSYQQRGNGSGGDSGKKSTAVLWTMQDTTSMVILNTYDTKGRGRQSTVTVLRFVKETEGGLLYEEVTRETGETPAMLDKAKAYRDATELPTNTISDL